MKLISEFPFRNNFPSIFTHHYPLKPSRFLKPFCSYRPTATKVPKNVAAADKLKSDPWITKWPSNPKGMESSYKKVEAKDEPPGPVRTSAIDRIVLRLRNLGLGDEDEEEEEDSDNEGGFEGREDGVYAATGEEKLGDLLKRDWVRPDKLLVDDEEEEEGGTVLPWEREEQEEEAQMEERGIRKRTAKAPTLAELTMEDAELRRLRTLGNTVRERITVPKAGVTGAVLEKIHDQWRKNELVRLKFHEFLARDMKTAHEVVERRTGGLVIWRAGSVMMVYRGVNYSGPSSRSQSTSIDRQTLFVPDVSLANGQISRSSDDANSDPGIPKPDLPVRVVDMTEEEAEFDSMLDDLGPRFEDWWGTGILPVDGDLLPQTIPGYKTPFRLLPTGMRSRLTNAEITSYRKMAKSIPCHFALGRNRNHQGLAAAIINLWEKSLVVKIAVKRGIQNTNNKLMAEELKKLTGGVLLLRNKYYIVMYRGKDFVPASVAVALAERQELTKQIQDVEEKVRQGAADAPVGENGQALAGTLAEFYEAQAQWGREISSEEHDKMIKEASKTKITRVVKRLEHKLFIAQAKRHKADKELAKIRESWLPVGAPQDQETITDEERVMFRRVGLRMKPYLPLGIRGVFDGVIENMHLHWKHRELVKLISKPKELAFVEETARLLEHESGGILIDMVRVPKGYAIIYYRGKNYRRPISIRPRNLPTKSRALRRWKALQRYEALSQHVDELEKAIEQMKLENGISEETNGKSTLNSEEHDDFNHALESEKSDDEAHWINSDSEEDEHLDSENDEDSKFSTAENDDYSTRRNELAS